MFAIIENPVFRAVGELNDPDLDAKIAEKIEARKSGRPAGRYIIDRKHNSAIEAEIIDITCPSQLLMYLQQKRDASELGLTSKERADATLAECENCANIMDKIDETDSVRILKHYIDDLQNPCVYIDENSYKPLELYLIKTFSESVQPAHQRLGIMRTLYAELMDDEKRPFGNNDKLALIEFKRRLSRFADAFGISPSYIYDLKTNASTKEQMRRAEEKKSESVEITKYIFDKTPDKIKRMIPQLFKQKTAECNIQNYLVLIDQAVKNKQLFEGCSR